MTGPAPYLLIDAGNSRIKWALADGQGTFVRSGVFAHAPEAGADLEWAALPEPSGAWISNVAGEAVAEQLAARIDARWPGLRRSFVRACARQCGVTNGYGTPERLGSDRWASLIGARAAFPGEALLIATLGTATTLEALTADGRFVGGMIAPGWSLMMRSLGEHTAQLPTLAADSARILVDDGPAHWFATDTPHAIAAGSLFAQAGLIERAWRELSRAWGKTVRLVVGGGAAEEVAQALDVPHTRHDTLVLAGLALIAMQGRSDGSITECERDVNDKET